jgi:hypothetical protein
MLVTIRSTEYRVKILRLLDKQEFGSLAWCGKGDLSSNQLLLFSIVCQITIPQRLGHMPSPLSDYKQKVKIGVVENEQDQRIVSVLAEF